MTVDIARAAVITGDGVVARYPGVLCVARCPDRDALARLLDVCAGAAGPDPGRVLARRLAQWMGGPDAPGDELEFGTVATTGDQLGVFLVGAAAVVVPGIPLTLSGADAATWTDRLIPLPEAPVVLALDGLVPPTGFARGLNDLRAGVVPGAGAVLFPVGRPAPAGEEPDTGTPARTSPAGARNGATHQRANGSRAVGSDGAAAVDDPRGPGSLVPESYEWFADWSDGAAADATVPGGGPQLAVPSSWPWTDPAAGSHPDRAGRRSAGPPDAAAAEGGPSGAAGPSGAREAVAGDPAPPAPAVPHAAAEGGPVDEPGAGRHNGRGWTTETPTPPGGSERAAAWVDPAAEADRPVPDGAPRAEGRHAIVGAGGAAEPVASDAVTRPDTEALDVDREADRVPDAERIAAAPPDDDATPVVATPVVAAVAVAPAPAEDEPEPPADLVAPAPAGPAVPFPAGPTAAEPDPDEPLVHGRVCEEGHLNDPRASSCPRCGAPVENGAGVVGTRPPLGRIVFDDGAAFTVDAAYLVGRMPEADPRARSGELRSIVVEDRSGSVSRVHAEILIDGWDVVLVDSGSRNGTFVAGPDEDGWTPLAPGRTSLLLPGTRVRMGGRTFVFEPAPAG